MNENGSGLILNFILRAVIGITIVYFVNKYLDYRNFSISVGMNAITLLTSGILGIPGVALLYGILFYQSL